MIGPDAPAKPNISIFRKPGCSSCLTLKEFVESHGLAFESVNLLEYPDAMAEVIQAGLQSIPVLRRGQNYIYAQSLDNVAALLESPCHYFSLPVAQLLSR